MTMTAFYAWQNDSDNKTNRYLIRDTIKAALKDLQKDLQIEDSPRPVNLQIDHDTKNTPGMAPIISTILEKISKCSVFIADLTYVARIKTKDEGETKKGIPNPNVMLELGYALSKIGWERIICILNESYGSVTEIPFDIAHNRQPITYCLSPSSSNRKQVAKELSPKIKMAIKAILESDAFKKSLEKLEVTFRPLPPDSYDHYNYYDEILCITIKNISNSAVYLEKLCNKFTGSAFVATKEKDGEPIDLEKKEGVTARNELTPKDWPKDLDKGSITVVKINSRTLLYNNPPSISRSSLCIFDEGGEQLVEAPIPVRYLPPRDEYGAD